MGAVLSGKVPSGTGWVFEPKYDGYRIVAYIESGKCVLITRGGLDYAVKFPTVAVALENWAKRTPIVLDGEMIVADSRGVADFQALQGYVKNPSRGVPVYMAFDVLAYKGEDLRGKALLERKKILKRLLANAPECVKYSEHEAGDGTDIMNAACRIGLEGIVAKRSDSAYFGGKNGDWVKVKCAKRQEFVIGGYTVSDKQMLGLSSVLLGVYDGQKLMYCGRAGTGWSETERSDTGGLLNGLRVAKTFFHNPPAVRSGESIVWVKPDKVAEVAFAAWTDEGLLRQASFKGLREDKLPKDIVREREVSVMAKATEKADAVSAGESVRVDGVEITKPNRLVFDSGVTKLEVAKYYQLIAKRMLPYAANRILSIVRCPKGATEACFYKKHPDVNAKGVVTVPVKGSDGVEEDYFCIKDAKGLVSEAQMGTIEFHVWGSYADDMERPDMMVFDLDPDEGMGLDKVRQGVRDLKQILDGLGLKSFLKTSGGKGYHIVVPFVPSAEWETFKTFAKGVAEVMERQWPDRYTVNMRKEKRKGKIFIDWVRNGRGATSVAPYSLRARAGARVSMPIKWSELETVAPDGFGIEEAIKSLDKPDPWRGYEAARAAFRV